MDDADIVTERAEREMDLALRSLRAGPTRPTNYRGDWCLLCDGPIPEARQRALPGCCTCIACQEKLERGMGR